MIFRNLIFSALFVGLISGLVYGVFQQIAITPLIIAAEEFEVISDEITEVQSTDGHTDHDHSHDHLFDEPMKRSALTILSNALIGTAFSIFLIALMAFHNFKSSKQPVNLWNGLAWGGALVIAIFAAPAYFGLHPELPGTIAASLEHRQFWWIICTLSAAMGIALIYYCPPALKITGLIIFAAPHFFADNTPANLQFANPAPEAVEALTSLTHQFFIMTSIGMVIFCLLIGALSGFASEKYVRLDSDTE